MVGRCNFYPRYQDWKTKGKVQLEVQSVGLGMQLSGRALAYCKALDLTLGTVKISK
jgi:hypothetical protein